MAWLLQFHTATPKKHPFYLNLPPTYKYIPENLFLRRSSVELESSDFWPLEGFPLNISPLPTVQNSSKKINSQNQFTHTIFTKMFYLKDLPILILFMLANMLHVSHLKNPACVNKLGNPLVRQQINRSFLSEEVL